MYFCGEEGSGEFAGSRILTIKEQIQQQKEFLSNKWNTDKYIAYFQNFTNTYSSYDNLRENIMKPPFTGRGSRPSYSYKADCLSEEVLELLTELNEQTYLWIELGLQTIHGRTSKFIRRGGYPLETYNKAIGGDLRTEI